MESYERRRLQSHALGNSILTQVSAPRPSSNRDSGPVTSCPEPHLALTEENQRSDVAVFQVIHANHVGAGLKNLFLRKRNPNLADMRRIEQAPYVFRRAKHG